MKNYSEMTNEELTAEYETARHPGKITKENFENTWNTIFAVEDEMRRRNILPVYTYNED